MHETDSMCNSGVNPETNGTQQSQNGAVTVHYPAFPLFFTLSPLLVDSARKAAPRSESTANTEAESILR